VTKLPRLDYETRSPKFNIRCPEAKNDEEILAEIERKVVLMIGNYTHKEWECAQKILKHQGRVNRVLGEMKFLCPPCRNPQPRAKRCYLLGTLDLNWLRPLRKVKRAKLLLRHRVLQRAQKILTFWHNARPRLPKLLCPILLRSPPN
jgi:hypothetical protein